MTDSKSIAPAWTMSPSPALTARGCSAKPHVWTSWVFCVAKPWTPHTALALSFRDPDEIALEFFAPPP
jgi:hypothetical protein